jgi:hypothetical protein
MDTFVFNSGNFFMALAAGVLMAIGFQIVLTMLSVATGVSMIGNVEDKFNEPHAYNPSSHEKRHQSLMKVINSIGLWTAATACISLFFASMLAVKMSLIADNQINAVLGLSIWAAFFVVMMVFETRKASSLLGGIFKTVFHGMKSSATVVNSMFGRSKIEKTADAIRSEITHSLHDPHLKKEITKYMKQFEPQAFDWHKARKELTKLLSGLEVDATVRDEEGQRKTFIRLAEKHPHFSREDIKKLGEMFDEAKNMAGSQGVGDDVAQVKEKFAQYLQNTGVEALNPENLKEDLNKIVGSPKTAKSVVLNRIKQFDHPTLVSIVSKTTHMSQEQAEQVVGKVESVLESIKEKVTRGNGNGNGFNLKPSFQDNFEDKVRNYFSSLQRPEIDYDQLKSDFELMLHDPKASVDILKNRFKTFDRESLVAVISSNPHVTKEQAEKMVAKIEEARDSVIQKAHAIEEQIKERARMAREMAIHEAEHARQVVVLSAWWMFSAAVLSAGAAAVGGMLAY